MKKRLFTFTLLSLLILLLVPAALAQEERSGDIVTVAHDEVIDDDLYITGNSVLIDGTINGDLITFSSRTTINGTVEGDVLAMGQSLTINGEVGGSVRAAGMITTLNPTAHVGKDMFVTGYGLNTEAGSVVEGDIRFYGGQGTLNGDVGGDVIVAGAGVTINGNVGGDVKTDVGAESGAPPFDFTQFMPPEAQGMPMITGGIQIGENAQIDGQVKVTAPENANLAPIRERFPDADIEETAVTTTQAPNPWISVFTRLISLLLVGALVAGVKPDFVAELSGFLKEKPLPSFGWGIVTYLLSPFIIVLLIGAFGLMAGFFGLLSLDLIRNAILLLGAAIVVLLVVSLMLILLFLTKIMVGYLIGHFIFSKIRPTLNEKVMWPVLLGLVVVVILVSLPYVGGLMTVLIHVFGLGALIVMWRTPKYPVEKEPIA